jgi:catalase (peroxidase I)
MFTTDLALAYGDDAYEELSREYADSFDNITRDFGIAWYQLMSRDMGPRSRCLGDELPPTQYWEQKDLDQLSTKKPNYIPIRTAIQSSIDKTPVNAPSFADLAVMCASTYRTSDYQGGCNGAAIRFPPSIDWPSNANARSYLALLDPIKEEFPEISWSDLIVLAGQTAVESMGGLPMPFCGGRVDASDGSKSMGLQPRIYNNNTHDSVMYDMANTGMSLAEGVALFATPVPLQASTGDDSIMVAEQRQVDLNQDLLLSPNLYSLNSSNYPKLEAYYYHTDYLYSYPNLKQEDVLTGDLAVIVTEFKRDNAYFLEQYAKGWNFMMTADMFDGPTANACQGVSDPTLEGQEPIAPGTGLFDEDGEKEPKPQENKDENHEDADGHDEGTTIEEVNDSAAPPLSVNIMSSRNALVAMTIVIVGYVTAMV